MASSPQNRIIQSYTRQGGMGGARHGVDIQLATNDKDHGGERRLQAIHGWCSTRGIKFAMTHAADFSDCGVEFQHAADRDALLAALPGLMGSGVEPRPARTRQAEGWLGGDLDLAVRLLPADPAADAAAPVIHQIEIALDENVSSPARARFFQTLAEACKAQGLQLARNGRRAAILTTDTPALPPKLAAWLEATPIPRRLAEADTDMAQSDTPKGDGTDTGDTPPNKTDRRRMTKPAVPSITWRAVEFRGTLGGSRFMVDMFLGRGTDDAEAVLRKAKVKGFLDREGIAYEGSFDGTGTACCFNLADEAGVEKLSQKLPEVLGVEPHEVFGGFSGVEDYPGHMGVPFGTSLTSETATVDGASRPGIAIRLPNGLNEGQRFARLSKLCQYLPSKANVLMEDGFQRMTANFADTDSQAKFAELAASILHGFEKKAAKPTDPANKGPGQ